MVFVRSLAAVAVIFVAFSSAYAHDDHKHDDHKHDDHGYPDKHEEPKCYPKGERCAGAEGYDYVKYMPCCDKGYMCVEDKHMGWGRFCKKPSDTYWSKCYIEKARCEGAPGKPYVEYHKCCGKADCVEDKHLGWGKFCKGGDYDTEKYDYHKKDEYKEDYGKSYKGDYYESYDGKIKYEHDGKSYGDYDHDYDDKKYHDDKYDEKYDDKYDDKYPKDYDEYPAKYDAPEDYDYKKYGDSYGAGKGKVHKGTGRGAGPMQPRVCRLGGGVLGAGCGDPFPNPLGNAIFYVSLRVPGCRGGFPCNALVLLKAQFCGLLPSATTLSCNMIGEQITTSRMAFLDRQETETEFDFGGGFGGGLGGPGGRGGPGGPTAPATTTTTTTGGLADGAVTSTINGQIAYGCEDFARIRNAAIEAIGAASSWSLDESQCLDPVISPVE